MLSLLLLIQFKGKHNSQNNVRIHRGKKGDRREKKREKTMQIT